MANPIVRAARARGCDVFVVALHRWLESGESVCQVTHEIRFSQAVALVDSFVRLKSKGDVVPRSGEIWLEGLRCVYASAEQELSHWERSCPVAPGCYVWDETGADAECWRLAGPVSARFVAGARAET